MHQFRLRPRADSSPGGACHCERHTHCPFSIGDAARTATTSAAVAASVVVAGVEVDAGNALGPEHLDVAAVVLDREAEVVAVPAELLDREALEVARHLVVAPGPHHEHVPPDLVPLEPRLRELVDALRSRREQ